jgi:uncharacterized damage-inducible protein DinB
LEYLQGSRSALVGKLDGLSEYDVRRPRTATGTNLLGLVKHLAGVEITYFGPTFGRPFAEPPAWLEDAALQADPNADLWATVDESREGIVALYRRAWAHADATIAALSLDALGRVPHWPAERATVTLQHIIVHVFGDTARHAGHADILREAADGAAGLRETGDNMPSTDAAFWAAHVARVEAAATAAQKAAEAQAPP